MSHAEFMRWALGYQKRDEMHWHRWRLGICYNVNLHSKNRITPQDVMSLPMDSGSVNGIDEETKEQLKKFMSDG